MDWRGRQLAFNRRKITPALFLYASDAALHNINLTARWFNNL
jgi:hypothetical protein